jgi:hypothetical protein
VGHVQCVCVGHEHECALRAGWHLSCIPLPIQRLQQAGRQTVLLQQPLNCRQTAPLPLYTAEQHTASQRPQHPLVQALGYAGVTVSCYYLFITPPAHQSYHAASTSCGWYVLYISPSVGLRAPLGRALSPCINADTSAASAACSEGHHHKTCIAAAAAATTAATLVGCGRGRETEGRKFGRQAGGIWHGIRADRCHTFLASASAFLPAFFSLPLAVAAVAAAAAAAAFAAALAFLASFSASLAACERTKAEATQVQVSSQQLMSGT